MAKRPYLRVGDIELAMAAQVVALLDRKLSGKAAKERVLVLALVRIGSSMVGNTIEKEVTNLLPFPQRQGAP